MVLIGKSLAPASVLFQSQWREASSDSAPMDTTSCGVRGGQSISSSAGENLSRSINSYLCAGPKCFYCKKRGSPNGRVSNTASKEWEDSKAQLPCFQEISAQKFRDPRKLSVEYAPFSYCGSVSFMGPHMESPVTIFRDIGAPQSLISLICLKDGFPKF